MKTAIISFTTEGERIAKRLKEGIEKRKDSTVDIINKNTVSVKISSIMKNIFNEYDSIVFVSSTGIAVRMIAPYIVSKTEDPAVIVIDDLGKYVISLLSGHIGGANELSSEFAKILGANAIITTASDGRNIDAVDVFAMRNNLHMDSMEAAKQITHLMVEGKRIKIISDKEYPLKYDKAVYDDPEFDGVIIISNRNLDKNELVELSSIKPYVILRPRNLYIGIGCRKGKSYNDIRSFVFDIFKKNRYSLDSIVQIGSIDIKKDEEGIKELSRELNVNFKVFSKNELSKYEHFFKGSDFVKKTVGVSSVSETAAYAMAPKIVIDKVAENGITVTVSEAV